jgi:hypothetical protein
MTTGNGSGLWGTQAPTKPHLIVGPGGVSQEVFDVRKDLSATLAPLVAITVEEYDGPPPAVPAAIMPVTASQTAAVDYQYAGLTGSIGDGVISPPRNIEVVVAGSTATQAPASFTINGLDAWGRALSETISGTSGGAATYTGTHCFAKVTSVTAPAGTGTGATFSIGTGVVIGLSQYPKLRAAQALPLVRREVYDGNIVTNGVLTLPATNMPFGAYTPGTAPATVAAAVATGSVNLNAGGTFGPSGTLSDSGANDLILKITVNGVLGALTLNGTTNVASAAAFIAAIEAEWPALTASINGSGFLVLTDKLAGAAYSIVFPSDVTNTAYAVVGLGGTGGATDAGTGHYYAIEYEFDATQLPNASLPQ